MIVICFQVLNCIRKSLLEFGISFQLTKQLPNYIHGMTTFFANISIVPGQGIQLPCES